jgi:5-methyltetrahydropteroyltriglutamate--homocysteine methyltransferase
MADLAAGKFDQVGLSALSDWALAETIERIEATGSTVVTDGEQTKPRFVTYPLDGVDALAPDGAVIPFADGHVRQLPRLTGGPFR